MANQSSSSTPGGVAVLFVCLGNICRSTMAEGVFTHNLANPKANTPSSLVSHVDSCGTGAYHVGSPPDPRTTAVLKKNGITPYTHAARKLRASDFDDFDWIFAMDADNLDDILALRKRVVAKKKSEDGLAKVTLFGAFGGRAKDEEVIDPYYGADNGFDVAYEQMQRFSAGFLHELNKTQKAAM